MSAGIVSCNWTCGTCYAYVAPVSIVSDQLVNNKSNEITIFALAYIYIGLLYLKTLVSTHDCCQLYIKRLYGALKVQVKWALCLIEMQYRDSDSFNLWPLYTLKKQSQMPTDMAALWCRWRSSYACS